MKIQNPILTGFQADPSICRDGDDFYIANSTFEWFPGVQIHHSKDLVNWQLVKRPLERTSQLNMLGNPDSGGIWAPCLTKADGLFWLIYTDVKQLGSVCKDTHNYLVTTDEITGEWSDPIYLNSSGFDPSLFHDDDGKKYLVNMVWDPRADKNSFSGIVLQEYSVEQKKLVGPKKVIFKGTNIRTTEGPHIYKKDGYYYLMTAEGGTSYQHAVTIARSRDLWGEYEVHPENPILTAVNNPERMLQKAGHASMVPVTDDLWVLVHLCGRPLQTLGDCPLGRETAMQRVVWKNGWPYLEKEPLPQDEIEDFGLPLAPVPSNALVTDDFDDETLNVHFQSLRAPIGENASLTARKGHLRLYGRESLASKFTQAHLARRWQSFEFTAETKLDFHPESFQQMAGLTMYYDTGNWFFFHVTMDETLGRVLELCQLEAGAQRTDHLADAKVVVPETAPYVYLRAMVDHENMKFAYSFDGETYTELEQTFYAGKLSDDYIWRSTVGIAGCFTGAFVGLACVDVSGERIAADFDSFTYCEK